LKLLKAFVVAVLVATQLKQGECVGACKVLNYDGGHLNQKQECVCETNMGPLQEFLKGYRQRRVVNEEPVLTVTIPEKKEPYEFPTY